MNVKLKHEQSRQKANIRYHNFLNKYRKDDKIEYIFCEGDEDIAYYSHAIKQLYPQLKIVKIPAGGKDNVILLNSYFDWTRFNQNQLLFFVDRDMSYWLGMDGAFPDNIYVTDGYSIENDVVKEEHFMCFLEDLCGFALATEEELSNIKSFYREKWISFTENSKYIMAALTISFKHSGEHLAKYIEHKDMIKIRRENVWVNEYKDLTLKNYIDQIFRIEPKHQEEIEALIKRFALESTEYYVRGKWAISFLVKMINCIVQERQEFAPSLCDEKGNGPKCLCNIQEEQAITILGTRIPIVSSLHDFCANHISVYLEEFDKGE